MQAKNSTTTGRPHQIDPSVAPAAAENPKLAAALYLARRGCRVFPVAPNDKRPLIAGMNWPFAATSDEAQIRKWWTQYPDANIGRVLEAHEMCADSDIGRGGIDTYVLLDVIHGWDKTQAVKTWSGGRHTIYELPEGVRVPNSKDVIGPGIEIKTAGTYLVGTGSTVNGKDYVWEDDGPLAAAPEWLIKLALQKKAASKTAAAGQRFVSTDADEGPDRALAEKIVQNAPHAEEGNRDNTAFIVAARLVDMGCTQPACERWLTVWNETKCEPPLDPADIERISHSSESSRQKAAGIEHPSMKADGFEPVEIDESKAPPPRAVMPAAAAEARPSRKRLYVIRADEGARRALETAGEPLIEGALDRGTMSVLIGAPNSGKTFLVLDWCYHIATGRPWHGRKVKQGGVVYLAAEAGAMINKRLAALERHYGPLADTPLYVIPCPADLAHGTADADAIVALIRDVERTSGQKVELFIIDTLHRAISGGDENSSKDMGALISAVDRIRDEAKTHTLIVHHPGWEGKRARGFSGLLGSCDTEMTISKDAKGKASTLKFSKQRDIEPKPGEKIQFKLKPIRIGWNSAGDGVTSCHVEVLARNENVQWPLTSTELDTKDAIYAALRDTPEKVFGGQFVKGLLAKTESGKGCCRQTIGDRLTALTEKGWVNKIGRNQYLIACREMPENDGSQEGDVDGKMSAPLGADIPASPAPLAVAKKKKVAPLAPARTERAAA